MPLSDPDKSTVASFYTAFAPDDAPQNGPAAMCEALERLPAHRLAEIRQFLALARTPAFGVLVFGLPKRWTTMNEQRRRRALLALRDHPVAKLRTAFQAFKRLALFVAYSYAEPANATWARVGYQGPQKDRATFEEAALTAATDVQLHYDVIVIGSGAGGGVAAATCAASGMSVLVLEAGPPAAAFANAQSEFDAFANLYLDSGLTSTEDLGVSILSGSCIGGGTTVNWSTSLVLSEKVANQWERESGVDFNESLGMHYRAVSERLKLAPTFTHNANNTVLKNAAETLDWRGFAHPRNAAGCGRGCGFCGFGCAYNRKASTARTYLVDAAGHGAHVVAGARVERIHTLGKRARAVNVMFSGGPELMRRTITAQRIVVAAGSLRTPALLASAGITHAALGAHLYLHPTTAVIAEFPHDVSPWDGPIQSYLIDEFSDLHDGYGVKLEAAPAHPGLAALAAPWQGRAEHQAEMEKLKHRATLIALVRDRGSGTISTGDVSKINYALNGFDAGHLRTGIAKLAEGALAAGATRVSTLHNRPLEISGAAQLGEFRVSVASSAAGANRIGIFSAHQMGTARMHADPTRGVVNGNGRVHGFENLYVTDASVFPLASGVNPMLTIMAIAHRTTSEFVKSG